MKNWEDFINAKDADDKSTWKQELSKINDHEELSDLLKYLYDEFNKDLKKFMDKGTKAAARRARNYAQKIKDTMGQMRTIIQNKK